MSKKSSPYTLYGVLNYHILEETTRNFFVNFFLFETQESSVGSILEQTAMVYV